MDHLQRIEQKIDQLAAVIESRQADGRWLTLSEAVAYSPFGERTLMRLIMDGQIWGNKVTYGKGEKWVVDRRSIDEYILGFGDGFEVKALEILRSVA